MVEKIEFEPFVAEPQFGPPGVPGDPPAPTVIGYVCAVTVTAVPPGLPFKGLAVYGVTGDLYSLNPPAPPPPPSSCAPPPPPATTK